jgi:two-component system, LytTR family, response regulator
MTLHSLIADDEPVARRHLARLLRREVDVEIVGEAENGVQAVRMLNEMAIDVLFLDVQMPGMDSFEVLRRTAARPFLVFTTAHDENALAAFRESAVEYLLKPIAEEDVARTMCKIRENAYRRQLLGFLHPTGETRKTATQILVSMRDSLKPLKLDQIICLEARDKVTLIHTLSGGHEADRGLGELEARLPESDFVRIHRRHIVNIRYIKELRKWGHRQYKVELTTPVPTELFVSRRFVSEVLQRLGGLAARGESRIEPLGVDSARMHGAAKRRILVPPARISTGIGRPIHPGRLCCSSVTGLRACALVAPRQPGASTAQCRSIF